MRIRNGVFELEKGKPLQRDINMMIPSGSSAMIIGKAASGKLVLLRSIVGKTNIIGEDPFDRSWNGTVTWKCRLEKEFSE